MADPAATTNPTFVDRYRAAGLERNPFAAPAQGGATCRAFVSRGVPDPPPPGSKTLMQVIGDSGYGKSSHLEAWRTRVPGPHHYVVRAPYRARWTKPPVITPTKGSPGIVYGDEVDRMPSPLRRSWFRALARSDATLVIGTHADLTRVGESAGFTVQTFHLEPLDRPTLELVIDRRLASVQLGEVTPTIFSPEDIDHIHQTSAGVPRAVDHLCHKLLAEKVS